MSQKNPRKTRAKDLSKQAPRPPSLRLGGYTILARTIDKARAHLAGTLGEFHFDCPLDNVLFTFKGLRGEDFKNFVATGASDGEIIDWVNRNGISRGAEEIERFAQDTMKAEWPPEKHAYRDEIIRNADPSQLGKLTRIFEVLELDDRVCFGKHKEPAGKR